VASSVLAWEGPESPLNKQPNTLSDSRRIQLLVDAIVDYAIYMLEPQFYRVVDEASKRCQPFHANKETVR
jgi:hypothetical protein